MFEDKKLALIFKYWNFFCQDEYETTQESDVLVIATEWNQFRNLGLLKIEKLLKLLPLLDLRNLYDPEKAKVLGVYL